MPFQIVRNNITAIAADAIVNTANPEPIVGSGVDHAVYRAAGEEAMLAARRQIGRIEPGTSDWTPAFDLPAKYVIHTVSAPWRGGNRDERTILRNCYRSSLWLADELECESVAFPLLATGSYGFPKDEALQIAIEEISAFLLSREMMVWLVVFDRTSYELSGKLFRDIESYIDEHQVRAAREEEYARRPSGRPRRRNFFSRRKKEDRREQEHRELQEPAEALREEEAVYGAAEEPAEIDALFSFDGFAVEERPASEQELPVIDATVREPSPMYSASMPAPERMPDFSQVGKSVRDQLFQLIDERGLDDPEVYKKANMSRQLFSKIRSNPSYRPAKKTALALAVALQLDLEQTEDLLGRAEYALSPSSTADLIVRYFIQHKEYDIYKINAVLFQYDQPLLGL